jgi:hypothetical protein
MNDPVDLRVERIRRTTSNRDADPLDVLRTVIDDYDGKPAAGRITKMIVLLEITEPDGTLAFERYLAGCSRYEDVAISTLGYFRAVEQWRKP